jgi:hypothetical protein
LPVARTRKFAGRRRLELNVELAEADRLQPGIGMDHDLCRYCIGTCQVVGGGQAVDEHAKLFAPRDRIDHCARIGWRRLACQLIVAGRVVQTAVNPA